MSPSAEPVPAYQTLLGAYHRAFAPERRAMIEALPLKPGESVLEVACGDGASTAILAGRVGPEGRVVASDLLPAYLDLARQTVGDRPHVEYVAAGIDALPFDDGTFDLVWCAQSLYSLPDPLEAVRAMVRMARPGGTVALLEDDSLHRMVLPWPIEVELAVRAAEWAALREESDRPRKYYVGRHLRGLFLAAGLEHVAVRTWASDRMAPLDDDTRTFFASYLDTLRERAAPRLDPAMRSAFERLVEPDSPEYLLDRADLTVTVLDHVVQGLRPAGG
jgi:SAM-dependent methyltransferase